MVHKLLVPLDGSPLAEQVLPYIQTIVDCRGAEMHLLSVAPLVDNSAARVMLYPLHSQGTQVVNEERERRHLETELQHYLVGVASQSKWEGQVVCAVRCGSPADEILTYAFRNGIELIAMCTHSRSGFARWAYGSVADRVLKEADCPVLLVRAKLL